MNLYEFGTSLSHFVTQFPPGLVDVLPPLKKNLTFEDYLVRIVVQYFYPKVILLIDCSKYHEPTESNSSTADEKKSDDIIESEDNRINCIAKTLDFYAYDLKDANLSGSFDSTHTLFCTKTHLYAKSCDSDIWEISSHKGRITNMKSFVVSRQTGKALVCANDGYENDNMRIWRYQGAALGVNARKYDPDYKYIFCEIGLILNRVCIDSRYSSTEIRLCTYVPPSRKWHAQSYEKHIFLSEAVAKVLHPIKPIFNPNIL